MTADASNDKEHEKTIRDLLKTNVNEHTEKKGNLTYLSWAWAWAEILNFDPAASFKVEMFDGKCYMDINGTAMVWVTVTVFAKPMTCMLPVMNHLNEPITVSGRKFKDRNGNERTELVNSFNVNTAIMRALTKGLALHGLGLYIYSGEDLPVVDDPPVVKEPLSDKQKLAQLNKMAREQQVDKEKIFSFLTEKAGFPVTQFSDCPASLYPIIEEYLFAYGKENNQ